MDSRFWRSKISSRPAPIPEGFRRLSRTSLPIILRKMTVLPLVSHQPKGPDVDAACPLVPSFIIECNSRFYVPPLFLLVDNDQINAM